MRPILTRSLKLVLIGLGCLFWGWLPGSILHGMIYFSHGPPFLLLPALAIPSVMLAFALYLGVLALRSSARLRWSSGLFALTSMVAITAEFIVLLPLQ